MNTFDKTNICS